MNSLDQLLMRHPPMKWVGYFALALAVLIYAWSPFIGGARFPAAVLAGTGLLLLGIYRQELFEIPSIKRWTLLFMLLWIPLLASWFFSVDQKSTTQAVLIFPAFYFTGLALLTGLASDQRRRYFALAILLVSGFWVIDSFIQLFVGVDIRGLPLIGARVTGLFRDLHQGVVMGALLPVLFWTVNQRSRALGFAAFALFGLVMVLSGSRTYLYFLLLMLLGIWWHLRPNWRWSLLMLALPALVAGVTYVLKPQLVKDRAPQTLLLVQSTQQPLFDKLDLVLSGRLTLWETGWHMFQSNPVTGIGFKTFKNAYPQFSTRPGDMFATIARTHAHQIYVELLAETGLVGVLGLLTAIWLCLKWYFTAAWARRAQAWPYGLGLAVIFFPINSTQPMYVPWWFPVILLLVCGMLAALDEPAPAAPSQA